MNFFKVNADLTGDCNGNGKFDKNSTRCQCNESYSGTNCEFIKCDKPCKNNGVCLKNTKTNQESCNCSPKFTGALCDLPVCLNYCYNFGICAVNVVKVNNVDAANITCSCISDKYSGDRCQFDKCSAKSKDCPVDCFVNDNCECLCADKCDKSYCSNGNGTCFNNDGELGCKYNYF